MSTTATELPPEKVQAMREKFLAELKKLAWRNDAPPQDGTSIIAIGRVIGRDEISTFVEPFSGEIYWSKTDSGFEGWLWRFHGLAVVSALEYDVRIDYWIESNLAAVNSELQPA